MPPRLDHLSPLPPADLARAERLAAETGEAVEIVCLRLGLLSEDDLATAQAGALGLDKAGAVDFPDAPLFSEALNPDFLRAARLLPLAESETQVAVAAVLPADQAGLDALRFALGRPVTPRVVTLSTFEAAFARLYGEGDAPAEEEAGLRDEDLDRLRDSASEAPVIRWVNQTIAEAVAARASDVHFEPEEGGLRLRIRVDGVLHELPPPPAGLARAILSRLKIMAHLDIAERRLPQDGRLRLAVRGQDVDFRVSTVPAAHGESIVLRILNRQAVALDLEALGFSGPLARRLRDLVALPHGILLATGPTGSGKSTTLYAALSEILTPERKFLTIEDPIEYQLAGVNQVQVKPQIGLSFAQALRAFLRHDPDVIMIGEIRDLETAEIAVQAALTGHLILSTLHTNDAPSALPRLMDMGVPDYLLMATINGVLAQRLLRRLCPACAEPYEARPEFAARLGLGEGPVTLYRAKGCESCGGSGYHGRTSIGEVMVMTDEIRAAVLEHAPAARIRELARAGGMQTLMENGLEKARAGETSVEEVFRVTREAADADLSL